uniref:Uncharacterized protein n=1 Tax=Rhizophora mucronata TaxID=61149 RepID=A0A2P2Q8F5_RHIMU
MPVNSRRGNILFADILMFLCVCIGMCSCKCGDACVYIVIQHCFLSLFWLK